MEDGKGRPASVAERVRKHRQQQKRRDLLAAVAAARLALGMPPGDHGRVLANHLRRIAKGDGVPAEYADLLDEAARSLSKRR